MIPGTILASYPTGSRFICNPPVMNTDIDYLVLVNNRKTYEKFLQTQGFTSCLEDPESQYPEESGWSAWRKGELNLMVSDDIVWYLRSVAVTHLAKEMNLWKKSDRIDLFATVRDGEPFYSGPIPKSH